MISTETKPEEMTLAVASDDSKKKEHRPEQALQIINVIKKHYQIVKSSENGFLGGKVFAIDKDDDPTDEDNDPTNAMLVDSTAFSDIVTALCVEDENLAPSPQAMTTALATIKAPAHLRGTRGLYQENIHSCTAKVFEQGIGLYMDHNGYVIHLDARDGAGAYTLFNGDWHYGNDSTYFYRPDEFLPLIEPRSHPQNETSGHEYHDLKGLSEFHKLFPQVLNKDWPLIYGYILMAWLHEQSEGFPILEIEGTQGSGKSTLAKKILMLASPEKDPGNDLPSNGRDVAVTAMHHRIFFYDNIDPLNRKQSNLLCRISTGDSISMRRLYSNLDSKSVNINAPILITSISMGTERQDFLDRSVVIRLDWGDNKRDGLIDVKFKKVAPHIMGSLLTLAAKVWQTLQADDMKNVHLGRLTDYSKILHAIDTVTAKDSDVEATHSLETYLSQRDSSFMESASDDPVYMGLVDMEDNDTPIKFNGTSHELYHSGTQIYEAVQNARMNDGCGWDPPTGAVGFGKRLSSLVPVLHARGWIIERRASGDRRHHGVAVWNLQGPTPNNLYHIPTDSKPSDSKQQSLPVDDPDDPAF